jgi:hypothetical protein
VKPKKEGMRVQFDLPEIDRTKLSLESARTPFIHSEYLNKLNTAYAKLKNSEFEYDVLYKKCWLYYCGKASPNVYKDKPLGIKILKSDVDLFIRADDEIIELKKKLEGEKLQVKSLEEILKIIGNRNWTIRNIIEWEKFQAGS